MLCNLKFTQKSAEVSTPLHPLVPLEPPLPPVSPPLCHGLDHEHEFIWIYLDFISFIMICFIFSIFVIFTKSSLFNL